MVLTNEELKKIYFGAYEFREDKEGYLQAFQFSKKQLDYFKTTIEFWYERSTATNAKTLEFTTSATKIAFDYKIIWKGSPDSFELMVDGLISDIVYVKNIMDSGTIEWALPQGEKDVVIYLPADATVVIKNFTADEKVKPALKNGKVLWIGDSITQGFGPFRSANTFVSVANRLLNYDVVNQGIAGYIYDKNSLMKMEGYNPDKIIVSMGTNQYEDKDMSAVEDFYKVLMDIYGNDIPVLSISPVWRGDYPETYPIFLSFCEKVKKIAGQYKNVKVIDGLKLVPHLPEYYMDNLHPNCLGCEVYGRNLVEEIRKIGF